MSRDPIAEQGGLNVYAFINNNGINGWDYLGLSFGSPGWDDVMANDIVNDLTDPATDYFNKNPKPWDSPHHSTEVAYRDTYEWKMKSKLENSKNKDFSTNGSLSCTQIGQKTKSVFQIGTTRKGKWNNKVNTTKGDVTLFWANRFTAAQWAAYEKLRDSLLAQKESRSRDIVATYQDVEYECKCSANRVLEWTEINRSSKYEKTVNKETETYSYEKTGSVKTTYIPPNFR